MIIMTESPEQSRKAIALAAAASRIKDQSEPKSAPKPITISKIEDVSPELLSVAKDVYLSFSERYNQSSWRSYSLWSYLLDEDKLWWVNFVKENYLRYHNAIIG